MARNEQLIRQHKLLQILEEYRFGRTLEELRDEIVESLGLSSLHTRSIRRDLEALQTAGVDLAPHETADRKVWKLGPRAKSSVKITASATELMALSLGRDLLYPLAGTPFWQGIETFWKKVQDAVPGSVWDHYERFRELLTVLGMPSKSYESHHGILATLNRAMLEHRVVEIVYHAVGKEPKKRKIEPYSIVFYQSSLYIVAAANEIPTDNPERVRHWKLDRFSKADALDEWYKIPAGFDLKKHLKESVGIFSSGKSREYRIAVSPRAARWVREDPWHEEQKIEDQPDGSVVLTVPAAHELEIITRVLALGVDAEVLSPATCRKSIGNFVKEMAKKYE